MMKVYGHEIYEFILDDALEWAMALPEPFSASRLKHFLIGRGIPENNGNRFKPIAHRAADRLIQRWRKSGVIEKSSDRRGLQAWSLVKDNGGMASDQFQFGIDGVGDRVLIHKSTGGVFARVSRNDPDWWLSVSSASQFSIAVWTNPDDLGKAIRFTMNISNQENG